MTRNDNPRLDPGAPKDGGPSDFTEEQIQAFKAAGDYIQAQPIVLDGVEYGAGPAYQRDSSHGYCPDCECAACFAHFHDNPIERQCERAEAWDDREFSSAGRANGVTE